MAKVVEFPMAAEAATEATVEAGASCFMLMAAHAAPRDYVSRCMIKAHPLPPSLDYKRVSSDRQMGRLGNRLVRVSDFYL